jgi:hypothetical protein
MAAAKRIIITKAEKETATLEVGSWKLNLSYEGELGKKVTSIVVNGTKGNNEYFNYNLQATSTSITFNNAPYDQDVIDAVNIEVADITKEV